MLTALANVSAWLSRGRSQTWMDSFWVAATVPVALGWLVNGTALPSSRATAGVGAAAANPLPATMVMPIIAAAALLAAMNVLVLDMVPLSLLLLVLTRPGASGAGGPTDCLTKARKRR